MWNDMVPKNYMTAILNFFRKRSEPQKKAFTLDEWEIWHTYSTYFTDKSDNLEGVASTLVGSGFAEYSCTSSGSSYWPYF